MSSFINFGTLTNGDLSFGVSSGGIGVTETDTGPGILSAFLDTASAPFASSSTGSPGIQWSSFDASIEGAGVGSAASSITLSINYSVDVTGSADAITGLRQLIVTDYFTGTGISASATETVTDSSGNVVGTLNWTHATGSAPITLAMGYQHLNVSLSFTESVSAGSPLTSLVGISSMAQGFAETPTTSLASLGDYVWLDSNANGIQDGGENGIAGVTVRLIGAGKDGKFGTGDDVTVATTTTDATGHYGFSNLFAGQYEAQFTASSGYVFSAALQGGNTATDSNPGATGLTGPITLAAGQNNPTIDAGLYAQTALGDYVWLDANANGVQDGGEAGIAGVTVQLIGAGKDGTFGTGDDISATTTTDSAGHYAFSSLTPGQYEVQFVAPSGDVFSPALQGGNTAADSNADATGLTAAVTLTSGQTDNTIDAGLYAKAALGDYVWLDANANGVQDGGETGVGSVTVNLIGAGADGNFGTGDDISATTTTDSAGHYAFTGLTPGQYEVQFVAPSGDVFSPALQGGNTGLDSNAGATGLTAAVTLTSGQTDNTIDAGLYAKAALGDYVWLDANANGVQDGGETGVGNVTVNLIGAGADGKFGTGDDTSATTTTDGAGHYAFTGLTPGQYEVQFAAPSGDVFSPAFQGGNTATDSNAGAGGLTSAVTLTSGQTDNTIDAGLYAKAALGDYVWQDTNANGVQDSGEIGVANVTVNLIGAGADNTFGTGDDTSATTTTDSSGNYAFTGLTPGQYEVQFVAPFGLVFSPALQGGDTAIDSNAGGTGLTAAVTLTSGQVDNTIDAGLVPPTHHDGATALIGDNVWLDATGSGVQSGVDAGPGLAGVTVNLLDSTGTTVLETTTTDSGGLYAFSNLLGGTYEVQFVAPTGYFFPPENANPHPDLASSANPLTGVTAPIVLGEGEINVSVDAGLYQAAALGDYVWLDSNANGIQDGGETGVGSVSVQLIGAGTDNLFGTGDDQVLATTTTDGTGHYAFTNLQIGTYEVQFAAPSGDVFSAALQGGNTAADSNPDASGRTGPIALTPGQNDTTIDAGVFQKAALGDYVWQDTNANGVQDSGETGIANVTVNLIGAGADGKFGTGDDTSAATTTDSSGNYAFTGLTPGPYEVQFVAPSGDVFSPAFQGGNTAADSNADATGLTAAVTLTSGQTDNTIDAGLYAKAALGDYVWLDTNANGVQDSGETGIAAATVNLIGAGADGKFGTGDDTSAATTTDGTGHYAFTGLTPGQYEVQFAAPSGDVFSPALQGGNTAADSNADATGLTAAVTLTSGQTDNTIDAGLYAKAALGDYVWLDTNVNGVQDSGETGIATVTVNLIGAGKDGKFGTGDDTTLATTTTDGTGHYAFTGLTPGQYEVQFAAPSGDVFSPALQGGNTAADSNADATGLTAAVTLVSGQTDNTIDAGLHAIAPTGGSIGDFVWFDTNVNGIQDTCEDGIPGVTVNLIGAGKDGKFGTSDDVTVATTTTDANGAYNFSSLAAGKYEVQVIAPAGYHFSPSLQGSNTAIDSNTNASTGFTAPVTITAGSTNNTIDAGLYQVAPLNTCALQGMNGCGADYGPAAAATFTDGPLTVNSGTASELYTGPDAGHADSVLLVLSATLSNIKALGSQSIQLTFDGQTVSFSASDFNTTSADGFPSSISGIAKGQVNGISFPTALHAAADFTYSGPLNSVGGTGSQLGAVTVLSPIDLRVDVFGDNGGTIIDNAANSGAEGIKGVAGTGGCPGDSQIGDYVWLDANANGIQDNGESGIAGVTVKLMGAGTDSKFGTSDDILLATTTTDANGHYLFNSLMPGQYEMQFIAPSGYLFGPSLQGGNTAMDSNANASGLTAPITLVDDQYDSTIDAGLTKGASIGDYVWLDTNANGIQDSKEHGASGVTVKLLGAGTDGKFGTGDDTTLATTTTDSSGHYSFGGLSAGQYEVKFIAPSGDTFSPSLQGSNTATDSNPGSSGVSSPITLTAGQTDNTIDTGLLENAHISVLKVPGDVVVASCQKVTYSYYVTNTGTAPLSSISVVDNHGTASHPDNVTATGVTSGGYNVGDANHNGLLDTGESWKYTASMTESGSYASQSSSTCKTLSGCSLPSGSTAWLSTCFTPTSTKDGTTYVFKGVQCTISGSGVGSPIVQQCADAYVTFSSSCRQATTVYDAGQNCWITTLPSSQNPGKVYLTGLPLQVPSGCDLSHATVTWSIDSSANNCGASNLSWQGSIAEYNSFQQGGFNGLDDYNQIGVKVCDNQGGYGTGSYGSGWGGWGGGYGYGGSGYGFSNDSAGSAENQNTWGNWYSGWGNNGQSCGTTTIACSPLGDTSAADTVTASGATAGGTTVSATDTKEVQVLTSSSKISQDGTAPTGNLPTLYGATVAKLEFTYNPGDTVSVQGIQTGMAAVSGHNGNSMAFIVMSNNSNPNAAGAQIYFEGNVQAGQHIFADATINPLTNTPMASPSNHFATTSGSMMFAEVFASQQDFLNNATPVQTINYDTSGTRPMHVSDAIGSLQLIGYVGNTGGHLVS